MTRVLTLPLHGREEAIDCLLRRAPRGRDASGADAEPAGVGTDQTRHAFDFAPKARVAPVAVPAQLLEWCVLLTLLFDHAMLTVMSRPGTEYRKD